MPDQQYGKPLALFAAHRRLQNGWWPAVLLLSTAAIVKNIGAHAQELEQHIGVVTNLKGNHSPDITLLLPDLARELSGKSMAEVTKYVRPVLVDLVVGAWAALQRDAKVDAKHPSPAVQFMRHVRNGCAHDNRILIRDKDPIRVAEWRGVRLTKGDNGKLVLYQLLNVADVFHLVNDVFWELFPEQPGTPSSRGVQQA
ncbi:MAG: hypothetical protein AAB502_00075 [Chloroflexota bacterium]